MKTPITAIVFLLATLCVKAQSNIPSKAQPDSMIKVVPIDQGRHTSYLYTIGGKIQTPEDIQMKLLAYAPSATEFRATKKSAVWSWVSFGGFAASGLTAAIEFAKNNKMAGESVGFVNGKPEFIYQHHSLSTAYIFTGIASAFLVSSVVNFVEAAKHSKQMLKVYNARFE